MEIPEKDFFDFIELHKNDDPIALRLKEKKASYNFNLDKAILQIESRQKYKRKLSNFLSFPRFLFPDGISGEQASHQAIASFHSALIGINKNLLDMTGGLGIDALTLARQGNTVTAIDIDKNKAQTLIANANQMNIGSLKVLNQDSIDFLNNTSNHYDVIFIDPSRRASDLKKVYNLNDCLPNVIEHQDLILHHTDKLLIKASPMLDVSRTIQNFPDITCVRVIGVNGECKEILIEIDKEISPIDLNGIRIEAIDLNNDGKILSRFTDFFSRVKKNIKYISSKEIKEGQYLLEPSAMIMKLAPWDEICEKFDAFKLGKSSHLFITSREPTDFPGRVTRIQKILTKQDRKSLNGFPASVVSRNYPASSDEIRKKYKLKEGAENFIYATRVDEIPILILTTQNLYPADNTI